MPDIKPTPWPDRSQKLYVALTALVLLSLSAWLGLKARNEARQYKFIGVPIERNTITISGEGRVIAVPDVAVIDLGMTAERPTVSAAQQENSRVMNQVIDRLKSAGIDAKDIQTTSYNVYPAYDYNDGRQRLRGYSVSQNVRVKIRNLDKVSEALGVAGQLGANQIGGVNFTIDDPEKLRQEARLKALANAKEKAKDLAGVVGAKLRRVVSFSETSGGQPPVPMYDKALGIGGALEAAAPAIEPGSSEIVIKADVTYEIE